MPSSFQHLFPLFSFYLALYQNLDFMLSHLKKKVSVCYYTFLLYPECDNSLFSVLKEKQEIGSFRKHEDAAMGTQNIA